MSDTDTDLFNKQETTRLQLNYMLGVGSQVKYWFIFLVTIIYQGCEVVLVLFLSWDWELLIDPTKMVVGFFILQILFDEEAVGSQNS